MHNFTQKNVTKLLYAMSRLMLLVITNLLTISGIIMAANAHSQNLKDVKVVITANHQDLKQLFNDLEKQSGFSFTYTEDIGKITSPKLMTGATSLYDALKMISEHKQLRFNRTSRMIAVSRAPVIQPPPTGSIKGRVVDFETAEPLPGATIRVDGANIGVSSDEKGYYIIRNLPVGKIKLIVSYVGYENTVLPNIVVTEGKETVQDIKIKASNSMKEVVITAGRQRVRSVSATSDKDLITELRQVSGVASGISSEQITKLPDRNAAEVVKRISGVSVVDDRFIVVRGMNERYNLTYLNDNLAPATELYTKAFAYDLLPSAIIDRIVVYKSPQADLLADFAGGAVKVYTKNTRPLRHLDIGVQVAHRPGSTFTDINSYKGGKYDFFGFDDGSRQLPSFSPSYFKSNPNTALTNQSTLLKAFSPVLDYQRTTSTPDMQVYANFYDNWKLGRMRLYDLTSVNFTHETRSYSVYNQTGNTYTLFADNADQNLNVNNQITNSQQTTEIGKINILENLTLRVNKNNQLTFKNFFVNEGRKLTTINATRRNILPTLDSAIWGNNQQHNVNLSFQRRLLYSGNVGGIHDFNQNKSRLDWSLGYSHILQNVPDQRNSTFVNYGKLPGFTAAGSNVGTFDTGYLGMINRLFIKLTEDTYNAAVNYSFKISPLFTLKAGTYQLYKTREVGRRFFRVNRAGLQPYEFYIPANQGITDGWVENYGVSNPNLIFFPQSKLGEVWSNKYFPDDGSGLAIYDATSPVDSYVASEQNNSGYIMGDLMPFDKNLIINAGLRVEYDQQKVAGAVSDLSGGIIGVKAVNRKTSLLPSVNINYKPDSAYAIRLGYGRTVNRPDFRELSPYNDFDFQNNQSIIGNPKLVSATIDNYDFRAELYPNSTQQNELINVGVFYKSLQNPIEQLRVSKNGYTDNSNFTVLTYGNAISAKVYGIEAEIKKSLAFIPGRFFSKLSFVANGALIKSTTRQRDYNAGNFAVDSTNIKGRPLQGQSPYVFNTGLYYENIASGTKIGLTYNVSGARIYAKSSGNPNSDLQKQTGNVALASTRPDLLQLPQKLLDVSVTQRVIKSLQAKLSIQNILNQAFTIVEDQNYNQRYDKEKPVAITNSSVAKANGQFYYTGDNIFQRYNPGRYFILQLTYAF